MAELPKVAIYTIVRGGRHELTAKSLSMLQRWSGEPFDHYVASNGADEETNRVLDSMWQSGKIKALQRHDQNWGQNIAANWLLDDMEGVEQGERDGERYETVLRWDDDALPRTRRFLKKLTRTARTAAELSQYWSVWAPKITKLNHPPKAITAPGDDIGEPYEMVEILGGICRLHPRAFFDGWRFNKYGSLGFGEAREVSARSAKAGIALARLLSVEVEHAYGEDGQKKRYPHLFTWEGKEVGKYIGYGL